VRASQILVIAALCARRSTTQARAGQQADTTASAPLPAQLCHLAPSPPGGDVPTANIVPHTLAPPSGRCPGASAPARSRSCRPDGLCPGATCPTAPCSVLRTSDGGQPWPVSPALQLVVWTAEPSSSCSGSPTPSKSGPSTRPRVTTTEDLTGPSPPCRSPVRPFLRSAHLGCLQPLTESVVFGYELFDSSPRPRGRDPGTPFAHEAPARGCPVPFAQVRAPGRSGWLLQNERTGSTEARLVQGPVVPWQSALHERRGAVWRWRPSTRTDLVAACAEGVSAAPPYRPGSTCRRWCGPSPARDRLAVGDGGPVASPRRPRPSSSPTPQARRDFHGTAGRGAPSQGNPTLGWNDARASLLSRQGWPSRACELHVLLLMPTTRPHLGAAVPSFTQACA